jgi:hypothetical protein
VQQVQGEGPALAGQGDDADVDPEVFAFLSRGQQVEVLHRDAAQHALVDGALGAAPSAVADAAGDDLVAGAAQDLSGGVAEQVLRTLVAEDDALGSVDDGDGVGGVTQSAQPLWLIPHEKLPWGEQNPLPRRGQWGQRCTGEMREGIVARGGTGLTTAWGAGIPPSHGTKSRSSSAHKKALSRAGSAGF